MASHLDCFRADVLITMPNSVLGMNSWTYYLWDPTTTNPGDGAIVSAIGNKLTAIYQDIQAMVSTAVEFVEVEISRIEWNGTKWIVDEYINTVDLNVVGNDATDMAPHGVAAVVTGHTDYPKTRARKFFPGIGEDNISGSTISAGLLTLLANLAVEWMADYGLGGDAYLVGAALSTVNGQLAEIIRTTIPAYAGYQRRRKPGVGQ